MEPKKNVTLQQRFGFEDSDLKTPKHDEIVFWLDKNMKFVLRKLFFQEDQDLNSKEFKLNILWEEPICGKNEFIIGFIDMICRFECPENWIVKNRPLRNIIRFEVKTKIESVGELIRQIRMYQQYRAGVYVVVSPDDRFFEQIQSQGILCIKYEDKNV